MTGQLFDLDDTSPAVTRPELRAWRTVLDVWVGGTPAPQGSKDARAIYAGSGDQKRFTGRVAVVERSKTPVKAWRADVRQTVGEAWACPGRCARCTGHGQLTGEHTRPAVDGAVRVRIEFVMHRPTSTPKRSTPPAIKRPDIDKLARSSLDAIKAAGVYTDDSRVTELQVSKRLAEIGEPTGARIRIEVPA